MTAPTPAEPSPIAPANPAPPTAESTPASGKGFPAETPVADMTSDQQVAYWKHYARRNEDNLKAYHGFSPDQLTELQTELGQLRDEKLSADEKTLKAARAEATQAAADATRAEYLPKLQAAEVKSIASGVISGDRLKAFMEFADPSKFVGDSGDIDEVKVMGALTAMYGAPQQNQTSGQRWQNAGQYAPPPPPRKPGEGGRAELERRFGAKTKPQ